ncbi:MAG: hypothetical protein HYR85_27345 [Planctomycetes bacterium]|nr:hypothetical protein [Planctomycetota bacterium]MBI3848369.1 hypothetical protein [Planctomycetota bacterium]
MTRRVTGVWLLTFVLLACPASAWDPKDHRLFVALAIEHSPPGLASFLGANLDEVVRGSLDPDRKFMDTENHTYHVDDGTRDNPDHVAYLASALVAMIRNRAPREKVAYWFGALSHYVSDIDEPLHTSDKDKRENWYHPLFEALGYGFESHSQVLGFKFDFEIGNALSGWTFHDERRRSAIDDVKAWQIANAKWAYRYYDKIGRIYTRKKALDGNRLTEIYRTCIDESINDVIDLWAHVYQSAETELITLPSQRDVFLVDVDDEGRFYRGDVRLTEVQLVTALREYVATRTAAGAVPSAYAEIDDRCDASLRGRLEQLCRASGIVNVSAIFLRKGTATSRFYRALKVHVASLVAHG